MIQISPLPFVPNIIKFISWLRIVTIVRKKSLFLWDSNFKRKPAFVKLNIHPLLLWVEWEEKIRLTPVPFPKTVISNTYFSSPQNVESKNIINREHKVKWYWISKTIACSDSIMITIALLLNDIYPWNTLFKKVVLYIYALYTIWCL